MKTKDIEKLLKATKDKEYITYKEAFFQKTTAVSPETMEGKGLGVHCGNAEENRNKDIYRGKNWILKFHQTKNYTPEYAEDGL